METYEKYLKSDNDNTNCTIVDETKKSNFVAKLIGLGILKKDKNGKLIKKKNWSKEKIQKRLAGKDLKSKVKRVLNKLI